MKTLARAMLQWLRRVFGQSGTALPGARTSISASAGIAGEQAAAAWLVREKGFRVLAANWRAPLDRRLEIDLIAREGDAIVFVEVKTRAADALVPGYFAAVEKKKKAALLRAARAYVGLLQRKPRTIRFDVVEVLRTDGVIVEIRHFENVPLFPKGFLRGR